MQQNVETVPALESKRECMLNNQVAVNWQMCWGVGAQGQAWWSLPRRRTRNRTNVRVVGASKEEPQYRKVVQMVNRSPTECVKSANQPIKQTGGTPEPLVWQVCGVGQGTCVCACVMCGAGRTGGVFVTGRRWGNVVGCR